MTAADYREFAARLQAARVCERQGHRKRRRRTAAGAGHRRCRRDLRFRAPEGALTGHDGAPGTSGKTVNRMLHINENSTDLLYKLEAVRLVCRTSGCAQRYLTHDALNGIFQSTRLTDDRHGTDYSQRFSELSPRHPGPRPDARRRDDRRQGRPLDAAGPAGQPRMSTCTSRSAGRTASSSAAPRRSSPARPICTNSW